MRKIRLNQEHYKGLYILIKVYEEGETFEEIAQKIDLNKLSDELESLKSFKFDFDFQGKTCTYILHKTNYYSKKDQSDAIKAIDFIQFKGNVSMKHAERIFLLVYNTARNRKYFAKIIGGRPEGIYSLLHILRYTLYYKI